MLLAVLQIDVRKKCTRCHCAVRIAGPSVVNVYINYEKKFAFVEFRTGEPTHDPKPGTSPVQLFPGKPIFCWPSSQRQTRVLQYIM